MHVQIGSGRKCYAHELQSYNANLMSYQENPPIIFTAEDFRGIYYPHQDVMVMELTIANCVVKRILIDDVNLADIVFINTLRLIGIEETKMEVFQTSLVGFNGKNYHAYNGYLLDLSRERQYNYL